MHMETSEEWLHDRIFRNVFIIGYEIICQAYGGLKRNGYMTEYSELFSS